jgi:hypothetical protein
VSKEAARDLRLMTPVHTEPVPSGAPATRQAEVTWIDNPVPGLTNFYYRLVAVDEIGNISPPSSIAAGRAFDESIPVPPVIEVRWQDNGLGVLRANITWTSAEEVLLQRRDTDSPFWVDLAIWRPAGTQIIRDPFSDSEQSYEYRVWARNATGMVAKGPPTILDPA